MPLSFWMLKFQALSVVPAGQVATVAQQDEQLFQAVAKMAERLLDQFNAHDLANTAWALTDSAALHARELGKRSSRGGSWGGWVIIVFDTTG